MTIQSTLVISNSKGLSEILRDIRGSTYQICRIEEKIIRLASFNKLICNWTLKLEIYFSPLLDFHVYAGTRFSLRDKRFFEIREVDKARVNCISIFFLFYH